MLSAGRDEDPDRARTVVGRISQGVLESVQEIEPAVPGEQARVDQQERRIGGREVLRELIEAALDEDLKSLPVRRSGGGGVGGKHNLPASAHLATAFPEFRKERRVEIDHARFEFGPEAFLHLEVVDRFGDEDEIRAFVEGSPQPAIEIAGVEDFVGFDDGWDRRGAGRGEAGEGDPFLPVLPVPTGAIAEGVVPLQPGSRGFEKSVEFRTAGEGRGFGVSAEDPLVHLLDGEIASAEERARRELNGATGVEAARINLKA